MMQVVHIAAAGPSTRPVERKPGKKELLHREALAAVAARNIHDEAKAKKMFQRQRQELKELIEKRDLLMQQVG